MKLFLLFLSFPFSFLHNSNMTTADSDDRTVSTTSLLSHSLQEEEEEEEEEPTCGFASEKEEEELPASWYSIVALLPPSFPLLPVGLWVSKAVGPRQKGRRRKTVEMLLAWRGERKGRKDQQAVE